MAVDMSSRARHAADHTSPNAVSCLWTVMGSDVRPFASSPLDITSKLLTAPAVRTMSRFRLTVATAQGHLPR